jgi:hypothetical protein
MQVAVILQLKDVLEDPVHCFNLVLIHFSLNFWILNFKVIFEILRGLPLLLSGWGLGSCCQLKSPLVPTSTGVLGASGDDRGMSSRNVEKFQKMRMTLEKVMASSRVGSLLPDVLVSCADSGNDLLVSVKS